MATNSYNMGDNVAFANNVANTLGLQVWAIPRLGSGKGPMYLIYPRGTRRNTREAPITTLCSISDVAVYLLDEYLEQNSILSQGVLNRLTRLTAV